MDANYHRTNDGNLCVFKSDGVFGKHNAKQIKAMRDAGDSYESIAGELGRSKSNVYRVCQTLGCMSAT